MRTARLSDQLELLGCIQCGKCTGGCPVALKTALNIRRLIYEMTVAEELDVGRHQELWDCTCCFNCVERCPKDVRPADLIIALRAELVESGRIPDTIGAALMGVFRQGNPAGMLRASRGRWADGIAQPASAQAGCELLYFVGCVPAYDPRVQVLPRALAALLARAGIEFATLGTAENCCGSEVRRMGEQGLFEMLAEENGQLIRGTGASRVVTTSPHCFNTLKNEYALDGVHVMHYTQLVSEILDSGRLKIEGRMTRTVTFHDPCFLGKQNAVFEEPRAVLSAIPGLRLVEMDRNRERSLCCEGGGGRMWAEGTNQGERIAAQRVKEAAETGADVLAVACPFCLLTLEDAVKVAGLENHLRVMDILELVAESIGENST